MKEIFSANPRFFQKFFDPHRRQDGKRDGGDAAFQPKIPHRPQKRAQGHPVSPPPQGHGQQEVKPGFPAALQDEEKHSQRRSEADQGVGGPGQKGEAAAHRGEQLIDQAQGGAQGRSCGEALQLQSHRDLHYPNSRRKKPPPPLLPSS